MKYKIKKITGGLSLGEGCIWDEQRQAVHFVDIEAYKIYTYYLADRNIQVIDIGDYIGCIALNKNNKLTAGVKSKIMEVDPDTKKSALIMTLDQPDTMRFNDGKLDKYGNLWIGTMAIDQSQPGAGEAGALYCIKEDKVQAKYSGYTIPNGMAWDDQKNLFYHIDTDTQNIDVYNRISPYQITDRRTLVCVDEKDGSPDGMCMDKNGDLWTAMWGGGAVSHYDPRSGNIIDKIMMPDKYVSCCVFGGTNQDTLYITTAADEEAGTFGGLYEVTLEGGRIL